MVKIVKFFKKLSQDENKLNLLAFFSLLILSVAIVFYGVSVRLNDYSPEQTSSVPSSEPIKSEQAATTEKRPENKGERVCYLTFDDGPSDNTLEILKVLEKYNAKATFFIVGTAKVEYLDEIKNSGNQIGIHCYKHDYSNIYSSVGAYKRDFNKAQKVVEKKTGNRVKLFRFPGGSSNTVSRKYNYKIMSRLTKKMTKDGYKYFDWNADSGDAEGNNVAVKKIIKNIKREIYTENSKGKKVLKPSVCILMHDSVSKETTVKALPKIIKYLRAKGYRFEVLSKNTSGFHHSVNN